LLPLLAANVNNRLTAAATAQSAAAAPTPTPKATTVAVAAEFAQQLSKSKLSERTFC